MITLIIDLIIKLLNFIIQFILGVVLSVFRQFNLGQFTSVFASFFNLLTKGLNLLYFVSGGWLFVFGDVIIALFILKHIALPVINFARRIVIK